MKAPLGHVLVSGSRANPARPGASHHLPRRPQDGSAITPTTLKGPSIAAIEHTAMLQLLPTVPARAVAQCRAVLHLPTGTVARPTCATLEPKPAGGDVATTAKRPMAAHHGEVPAHQCSRARPLNSVSAGGAATGTDPLQVRVASYLMVVVEPAVGLHDVGSVPANRPPKDTLVADAAAEAVLGPFSGAGPVWPAMGAMIGPGQ